MVSNKMLGDKMIGNIVFGKVFIVIRPIVICRVIQMALGDIIPPTR